MKNLRTFLIVLVILLISQTNFRAFSQSLGKFYIFSPTKAPKQVTLEYNKTDDKVKMTLPGLKGGYYWFKRSYKKIQTEQNFNKIYFCGNFNGNGKLVMFQTKEGHWLLTEDDPIDKYARKNNNCGAYKYDPAKNDGWFLHKEKSKTQSMNKEEFVKILQNELMGYCSVISTYWEQKLGNVTLPKKGMKMGNLKPEIVAAVKTRMKGWPEYY